jgi:pre-mRNA-processing factor 40
MSQWAEHKDENGKVYYYNAATNTSRWDKPPSSQTPAQLALEESPWTEYEDEATERKYYYNSDTKETVWEIPEEFQLLLDRVSAEIQFKLQKAAPKEYAPIGMDFRTKEEAQDSFNEVLDDIGVESHWSWEMCVRRGNKHKFYQALKSVNDRKEAFMIYINDLKERDLNRNKKQQELDAEILENLFDLSEITFKSKYQDVLEMFKDNEQFKSTNLLNRRVFFKKYKLKLLEYEKEQKRETRRRNLINLKELLPTLIIKTWTTWAEFQEMLEPHYENDKDFKEMDKMDIIATLEDYIQTLESTQQIEKEQELKIQKRNERKARESFKNLLSDLKVLQTNKISKILNINSKWKEIYKEIKDHPTLLSIIGNQGSTPLELFWDELMEMEDLYRPSRRLIFETVKSTGFCFDISTTFTMFTKYFEKEFKYLNQEHVKIAYDEFLNKAKSRQYEERKYQERKVRKMMDAFRHYLKYLEKPVGVNESWVEVRKRCKGGEFEALDEQKREEAFGKFVRRLKVSGV